MREVHQGYRSDSPTFLELELKIKHLWIFLWKEDIPPLPRNVLKKNRIEKQR